MPAKARLYCLSKVEIAAIVKKAAQKSVPPTSRHVGLVALSATGLEIKKRVDRLAELTEQSASTAKAHTKLELVKMDREKKRLEERLDGVITLTKRPDALLVIDTKHEKYAVKEANEAGIPVIAVMSSDCKLERCGLSGSCKRLVARDCAAPPREPC